MGIVGEVSVENHQFMLGRQLSNTAEPTATGSLLAVGSDFVVVQTGVAAGRVRVELDIYERDTDMPPVEAWEVVEESTIRLSKGSRILTYAGERVPDFGTLGLQAGRYVVRAYARGRDQQWDELVDHATEQYALAIAPHSTDIGLRRLRKVDSAWAGEITVHPGRLWWEPDPAEDASARMHLTRDEYRQQREDEARRWGGQPPPSKLANGGMGKQLAGIDRPVLDALLQARSRKQRTVACWAIQEGLALYGLDERPWMAPTIELLKKGEPAPGLNTIEYQIDIGRNIREDPHLAFDESTTFVVSGPDGDKTLSVGLVTGTLRFALNMPDPLAAALFCIDRMLLAHYPNHHGFVRRLRATHFPRAIPIEQYERWV